MKTSRLFFGVMLWLVICGCASDPKAPSVPLQLGMSRDDLRYFFGEPVRIEKSESGGENWYYRFGSWQTRPVGSTANEQEFGERISYVNAGVQFSRKTEEKPVHLSPEGIVVAPLPQGKITRD